MICKSETDSTDSYGCSTPSIQQTVKKNPTNKYSVLYLNVGFGDDVKDATDVQDDAVSVDDDDDAASNDDDDNDHPLDTDARGSFMAFPKSLDYIRQLSAHYEKDGNHYNEGCFVHTSIELPFRVV